MEKWFDDHEGYKEEIGFGGAYFFFIILECMRF